MKAKWLMMSTAWLIGFASAIPARLAGQTANPVPLINQPVYPEAREPGGSGFGLAVTGTGFVSGAVVLWNGGPLPTKFVSDSLLTAFVPAAKIAEAGTASIVAVNPGPGGGASSLRFLEVTTPTARVTLSISSYTAGSGPTSVNEGDFNHDGKADLVIANVDEVGIFFGNGDGTFQPQVTYAAGSSVRDVTVGDFNGDGILDLAVTNPNENTVSILLGNRNGTFRARVPYSTGPGPYGLAAADLNGDGKLDLMITDFDAATISVLLGNGDGTFQPYVEYATGSGPTSVAVGDFNRDGKLDLVTTNRYSDTISILLGNGDGTLTSGASYPTGPLPRWVSIADLNSDGKLDLVEVTDYPSPPTVAIYLGNGDGTFQSSVTYAIAADATSVTTGDFNGDGRLDLATSNYNGGTGSTVSILLGNGDGTFQPHKDYAAGSGPNQLVAGDFNDDGRLDLAVADQGGASLSLLLQVPAAGTTEFEW
jgi:hypothetical protein